MKKAKATKSPAAKKKAVAGQAEGKARGLESLGFDADFIPLEGVTRRGRRGLLKSLLVKVGSKTFMRNPSKAEVETLRNQELMDAPFREMMEEMFPRVEPWKICLLMEAGKGSEVARKELGEWLTAFMLKADWKELDGFTKARKGLLEASPEVTFKLRAMLYVFKRITKGQPCPRQNEVRDYLREAGVKVDETRKNEARDLFKGAILGNLPKGKPGRKSGKKLPS